MNSKLLYAFFSIAQAAISTNFFSEGAKFNVTLTCETMDSKCEGIRHTFELVTGFIENALLLEGQINVNAMYLWTIDGTQWESNSTAGFGSSSDYLDNHERARYNYASAILKQRGVFKRNPRLDDIKMYINPATNFYFPTMFGEQQTSHQTGAIDVIAHELIHGMGFASFIDKDAGSSIFLPAIGVKKSRKDDYVEMDFSVGVFDKFMYTEEEESIAQLIKKMNQDNQVPRKYADKSITLAPRHLKTMKTIEAYATKPLGLYFKLGTEKVYLDTRSTTSGLEASLSHLDSIYTSTDDMLMTRSSLLGHGVHERASNPSWPTSPFGSRTLGILEAIGYKLNHQPSFEKSLGGFLANRH
ncbi:hypothetical protein DSO57_1005838 [Entomophthora muscae]|uniref:Uncharacterized protein n=2 Tax=Entomophthora muscae TaxID=34485 RepID=A0ACC2UGT7_9FUNG|nr:hypothetical protein DSO57_1005837 [Entomophthora muscae]KAJ9086274.1 hypothetical protein DSO57_1005838 [Entomophthora muscae]